MSEFTNNQSIRIEKLLYISKIILEQGDIHSIIKENESFINQVIPSDFIVLFDALLEQNYPISEIKILANKILNIFHKTISSYNKIQVSKDSFLGIMEENSLEMQSILKKIRPVLKEFVKGENLSSNKTKLHNLLSELEIFEIQYTIKENILFPILEKQWADYRCLQIMWSFHDDIRKNIKCAILLLNESDVDMKKFNRCMGDIFFNMLAIKFREEYILFPHILLTITEEQLETMKSEALQMTFPYTQPSVNTITKKKLETELARVNLGTGHLHPEQIKLIFNHLPVDITFVDENDEVQYFSTPKKRIFPRTNAILGREVKNCHPPESVHIVEKIVDSFKKREKDKAQFWIKMKNELIFIQYFAVRDELNQYKGVLEVSQEISEIQTLNGEKKLLDW